MAQMTPEQAKAMQEKLSKMSPEELKAYQKQQCIFCQIIAGKVQSKKIFEDELSIGILDINPANPGHILLLPKEHYAIMPLMPNDIRGHLFMVAKALSQAMLKAIGAQGVNIFIANGVPAGQKAQHFMIHLIPRKEKDGVGLQIPSNAVGKDQLIQIRDALKAKIKEQLDYDVGEGSAGEQTQKETTGEAQEAAGKQAEVIEDSGEITPGEEETAEEPEPEEEPGLEEKEEEPEEAEPEEGPGEEQKFITSAKAKRFHVDTCPFGNKIKEDSRMYCTEEECEELGKKPCDCTGIEDVEEEKEEKPKKKTTKRPETQKKESKEDEAEEDVDLDDIARTLGL